MNQKGLRRNMKYFIGFLVVLVSLSIGYELGSRKEVINNEIAEFDTKFISNELMIWASRSLQRDTIYYELTTLPDKDKVIELIQSAALEGMEKELSHLIKLSKSMDPEMKSSVKSTIEKAESILQEIHNNSSMRDAASIAPS